MRQPVEKLEETLYERDFYAWTVEQAEKLRARAHNDVDWENVAEEIESVGRSEKHEIRKRLAVLLMHLLKWELQPRLRSHSWQSTISEQRVHIHGALEISPSLLRFPEESLDWSYRWARRHASDETGLRLSTFPETCPYTAEQALSDEFLPGESWSPDDLIRD